MSKASFAIAFGLRKFSNFCSEGSLTQGSEFGAYCEIKPFSDIYKCRSSILVLLATEVKFIKGQLIALFATLRHYILHVFHKRTYRGCNLIRRGECAIIQATQF